MKDRNGMTAAAQTNAPSRIPKLLLLLVWYQIIGGLASAYGLWTQLGPDVPESQILARLSVYHTLPLWALRLFGATNAAAAIVIGVGILKRYSWVRPLFVLVSIETLVFMTVDSERIDLFVMAKIAIVAAVNIAIAGLLYGESSRRFFSGKDGSRVS